MGIESDIQATWTRRNVAEREERASEFDAAIAYVNGDMQDDTEAMLQTRYRAAQSGGSPETTIEAVAVGLVKQYVDEMASLYTGTVTRTVYSGKDAEDAEITDKLNAHFERIGMNQRQRSLERIAILVKSCGQAWRVENGRLDPVLYPPHTIWPVKPKRRINPTNQDSYLGYVLDMATSTYDGVGKRSKREYAYVTQAETTLYQGDNVRGAARSRQAGTFLSGRKRSSTKPVGRSQKSGRRCSLWLSGMRRYQPPENLYR